MVCEKAPIYAEKYAMTHLQPIIIDKLGVCSPSSKQVRLRCIEALLKAMVMRIAEERENKFSFSLQPQLRNLKEFILKSVSEVLLCMKEHNVKSRNHAIEVLYTFALCYPQDDLNESVNIVSSAAVRDLDGQPEEKQHGKSQKKQKKLSIYVDRSLDRTLGVDGFLKLVFGGLAGRTHTMISATLRGLNHLIVTFRYCVSEDVLLPFLSIAQTLLQIDSKEIRKACLMSVRSCVGGCRPESLLPLLEGLISALLSSPGQSHLAAGSGTNGESNVKNMNMVDSEDEFDSDADMSDGEDDDDDDDDDEEGDGMSVDAVGGESISGKKKKKKKKAKQSEEQSKANVNLPLVTLVRYVLEKLIRKVGYEAVEAATPQKHKALLSNVRKRMLRQEKKSAEDLKKRESAKKRDDAREFAHSLAHGKLGGVGMKTGITLDKDLIDSDDESNERKRKKGTGSSRSQQRHNAATGGLLSDQMEESMDLLDSRQPNSKRFAKEKSGASYTFNAAGKLIVPLEEEEMNTGRTYIYIYI